MVNAYKVCEDGETKDAMTMRAVLTSALASVALATACATATPYAPASNGGYGYSDVRIEPTRYRVTFSGNSLTEREDVENALLYRAADLTIQNGFDWFEVVTRDTDAERRYRDTGFNSFYPGYFSYRYFHPRYGFITHGHPYFSRGFNDIDLREITRFEASAEIVLGQGPRPDRASAYLAADVEDSLRPVILFPSA